MNLPNFSFELPGHFTGRLGFDLLPLLYRGGAGESARKVQRRISTEELGEPILARLPLLLAVYEHLRAELSSGGSVYTLQTSISTLRGLYRYADDLGVDVGFENARAMLSEWIGFLYDRVAARELKHSAAFSYGSHAAVCLARAMGVPTASLTRGTRLKFVQANKCVLGTEGDKQNMRETFDFGRDLLDIIHSLSADACLGPLPILVTLRSTSEPVPLWCGLHAARTLLPEEGGSADNVRRRLARRRRRSQSSTVATRHSAFNLRLQAELMLFISQTGMNVVQAHSLEMADYRYETWQGSYQVRKYKNRRKGDVEFEIFSEYRAHFERYLEFRAQIVAEASSGLLFPFVPHEGRQVHDRFIPHQLKAVLAKAGRPFVPPATLRNTRVNWLLRSASDPRLVAEMGQHGVATMHRAYERPHHQRAAVEWTSLYQAIDPALAAVGHGVCAQASPQQRAPFVESTPRPDCVNAAGCLFCFHYRAICSFDYIWGLLSFKVLKLKELSLYHRSMPEHKRVAPVLTIERISEIAQDFSNRSAQNQKWEREAEQRISEGHYHERWAGFIQLAECLI